MNCLKRLSFALAFCLAASIPLWAQSASVVYVATGGPQIYAVAPGGTVTKLVPSVDANSNSKFTTLTVGPDNTTGNSDNADFFLYACDAKNSTIIRLRVQTIDPSSLTASANFDTVYDSVTPLSGPVCGRVDSNGDLYVSDGSSGVYVIKGVSTATNGSTFSTPSLALTAPDGDSFSGGGITQKNSGAMLVVDTAANKILLAPFYGANSALATAPPYGSLTDYPISGLDSPIGIARTSTNNLFVLNQGSNKAKLANGVIEINPADLSTTACAEPPSGTSYSSLAASEDNFVYFAVNAGSPKSQEVEVFPGSDCSGSSTGGEPVQTFSMENAGPPLGIAVPPVSLSVTPTGTPDPATGNTSWTFNFGFSEIQTLTPSSCTPEISAQQVSVPYLQRLVPLYGYAQDGTINFMNGQPVPFNGEGGFGTVFASDGSCQPVATYNNFVLGAFDDTTQFTNSRIIHCDGTGCDVPDTTGFWPASVGGLLPGDLTIGGKVPGFSSFFLANGQQPATGAETGTFCGFGSPLTYGTSPFATFKSGQNLSVKFKVAQSDGNCSNGSYITDAVALLSVAKVPSNQGTGTITPIPVVSSGNSTATEPIFSYTPNNQQYQFSLSLKGYASGTYALIVTFLSNTTVNGGATYVVTYFKVQ